MFMHGSQPMRLRPHFEFFGTQMHSIYNLPGAISSVIAGTSLLAAQFFDRSSALGSVLLVATCIAYSATATLHIAISGTPARLRTPTSLA